MSIDLILRQTLPAAYGRQSALAWSNDGFLLASVAHQQIILWDATTGKVLRSLDADAPVRSAPVFSPDSRRLAAVLQSGAISVWDTDTASRLPIFCDDIFKENAIAWSQDRNLLASAGEDGGIKIWDSYSGTPKVRLRGGDSAPVLVLAWSSDSQIIASAGYSAAISLWNTRGGLRRKLDGNFGAVQALAWSPDNNRLASGGDDKLVRLWDSISGRLERVLEGHEDVVVGLSYSFDGKLLASKSLDGTVQLWHSDTGDLAAKFQESAQLGLGPSAIFHPSNSNFATMDSDLCTVRIWECRSQLPPKERKQVFISYSHKDYVWLSTIKEALEPYIRAEILTTWDDTDIKPGDQWRQKIKEALQSSKVAILLVTHHFLASEFIAKNELQPLLNAASQGGLRIFWIAVSPSLVETTDIPSYQAANKDPSKPLDQLTPAKRKRELVEIARKIMEAVRPN